MRRRISASRQRHELSGYFQQWQRELYTFALPRHWTVQLLTFNLSPPHLEIYFPSRASFEKITPGSPPAGVIFPDGSFLVAHERVAFGYRTDTDAEPTVYPLAYSYHYQRPDDCYYFRYDHHPDLGDPATHPLHHLHAAGWQRGDAAFYDAARHPVAPTRLTDVLRLIVSQFPSTVS
jgi:hypothetical protein